MRTTSALASAAAMPRRSIPANATAKTVGRRAVSTPRAAMSEAVAAQRRGYARSVVRGLARGLRGRPTREVERVLSQALRPLGVRLSPDRRRELAAAISRGQPVDLP